MPETITKTYELISVKGVKGWIRDSWARRAIVALQQAIAGIVVPTASTANPQMDGTAAPGSSTDYARADHVHPSDTSKADAATTYTKSQIDAMIPSVPSASTASPAMDGTASPGSSTAWARADHVHPSDTSKQSALSQAQLDAISAVIASPTYYGTCSTAGTTALKEVTCPGFVLTTGAKIAVKFTNSLNIVSPQLNVNDTGAVNVVYKGADAAIRYMWNAGEIIEFIYDGTNFVMMHGGTATTTYYGVTRLSSSLTSTSNAYALTAGAGKSLQDQINALDARITALGG